jgi:hypothetical protein
VKNSVFILSLSLCLTPYGCEDSEDKSPPSVTIISPLEYSSVSEITLVKCEASDDDSVRVVELWVDSLATGITDSSQPYEFLWNTVSLSDSTEYSLMVMAEDMSNNISFSPSISVWLITRVQIQKVLIFSQ